MNINKNYQNLNDNYLFARVAQKVKDYKTQNPEREIISLGIGDVTLPLAPAVIKEMQNAVAQMGGADTFRGYGDYQGYDFLLNVIRRPINYTVFLISVFYTFNFENSIYFSMLYNSIQFFNWVTPCYMK